MALTFGLSHSSTFPVALCLWLLWVLYREAYCTCIYSSEATAKGRGWLQRWWLWNLEASFAVFSREVSCLPFMKTIIKFAFLLLSCLIYIDLSYLSFQPHKCHWWPSTSFWKEISFLPFFFCSCGKWSSEKLSSMGHVHVLYIGHVLWSMHSTASVRKLELQTRNIALLELLLGSIQRCKSRWVRWVSMEGKQVYERFKSFPGCRSFWVK